MKNESPEAWRETVRGILTEMGVHSVDNEALNLLSLIAQRKSQIYVVLNIVNAVLDSIFRCFVRCVEETCKLLKSCVNQAQATGRSEITAGDARVACRAYETTSFVHPRLFEVVCLLAS